MKTSVIRVMAPRPVATPRGAAWAAQAALWLSRGARSVWRALEAHGQRRASHEMRLLAERWESFDPALAKRMREAARFEAGR